MTKEKELFTCSICGCEVDRAHLYEFDEEFLCEDCFNDETVICDHCEDRIWRDENCGDSGINLCSACMDNYYLHCSRCHRIIRCDDACYTDYDDDSPYCNDCYDEIDSECFSHEYSYKPEPIFYGSGKRFFGVEFEIDDAGRSNDNAETLQNIANFSDELVYIKSDGSLDSGLEIVTHPMALNFHKANMPWTDVCRKALQLGYRSHKTGTCGLHVHVNRASLGKDSEIQDQTISRILFFVERFWQELLKFSRRTEYQVQRWAARYGYKDKPKEILETAKKGNLGRYTYYENETNQLHCGIITALGQPDPSDGECCGSLAGAKVNWDIDIDTQELLSKTFEPGGSDEEIMIEITDERLIEFGLDLYERMQVESIQEIKYTNDQLKTWYAEATKLMPDTNGLVSMYINEDKNILIVGILDECFRDSIEQKLKNINDNDNWYEIIISEMPTPDQIENVDKEIQVMTVGEGPIVFESYVENCSLENIDYEVAFSKPLLKQYPIQSPEELKIFIGNSSKEFIITDFKMFDSNKNKIEPTEYTETTFEMSPNKGLYYYFVEIEIEKEKIYTVYFNLETKSNSNLN